MTLVSNDQKFIDGLRSWIGTSSTVKPYFTIDSKSLRQYCASETNKMAKDGKTENHYKGKLQIGSNNLNVEILNCRWI